MENKAFAWFFARKLSTEKVAVWVKVHPVNLSFDDRQAVLEDNDGHWFIGPKALLAPEPHSMGRPRVRLEA